MSSTIYTKLDELALNSKVFEFNLTAADVQKIDGVCDRARNLLELIGDCGDEYRRR